MFQIGDVLISDDVLGKRFLCDLSQCKGACCIEGDAGAPVEPDEVKQLEDALPAVWDDLSAEARDVIRRQGLTYTDIDGQQVISIVNGRDCVFTCYQDLELPGETIPNCCLCAYERLYRQGKIKWCKPISCALYPIRVKELSNGLVGLNYNRWDVCKDAVAKGRREGIYIYQFLKEPLIKRFGEEWYAELASLAEEVQAMK